MFDGSQLHLLAMVPGALLLAVVGWAVLKPASDFRIEVKGNRVRFRGKFPASLRGDAETLLCKEMHIRRAVIYGNWRSNRVLRVSFRGPLEEPQRQRIRNYLKIALHG